MAELVDAVDSKSTGGNIMGVQVPLPVPLLLFEPPSKYPLYKPLSTIALFSRPKPTPYLSPSEIKMIKEKMRMPSLLKRYCHAIKSLLINA